MTHRSFSVIIIVETITTKHDILEQLIPIDAKWRELGNGLRLSSNYLNGLAQSNMTNQIRLEHVLQKWIDLNTQESVVNWKTIIDVVEGPLVQNKALAMKMYQDLKEVFKQQSTIHNIYSTIHFYHVIVTGSYQEDKQHKVDTKPAPQETSKLTLITTKMF